MVNLIEKLHFASRRYCIERSMYWHMQYQVIIDDKKDRDSYGYAYTNEALNTFPRYQILEAILLELEKFIPSDFECYKEAKELICLAGEIGNTHFTMPPYNEVKKNAIDEERRLFCEYINNLNDSHLVLVQQLFFRRILKNDERKRLWHEIKDSWNINGTYWYPLAEIKNENIIAFEDEYFEQEFGFETLRNILRRKGIERIWEIREGSFGYELDIEDFEPCYDISGEGYFFSEEKDWIIYASHESSVTIGGVWLLQEIKSLWSNWRDRIWGIPQSE